MFELIDVLDIRERNSERFRLELTRQDYLRKGNQLNRMARQCHEEAEACFEHAQRIAEQLEVL